MPGRSAVIVPIVLPSRLAALRSARDQLAARGVPAHVTILFPFLPVTALTPAIRSDLARLAARQVPFSAGFRRVEVRDAMVWLVPDDQRPFLDLTDAVATRWPDHPPYGGIHDTLIPHLTLLETTDGPTRGAARAAAVDVGPFEMTVRELTVITENASGTWQTRWHLPLGDRTTRARFAP
jgi:2'-5' RNA ligase